MISPTPTIASRTPSERTTEIAKEVARCARKLFGTEVKVLWFGSWPKGHAREHSDIDIALDAGASIPVEKMSALREAIDQIPTLYTIDIADLHAVGSSLRNEILREGIAL
jgi:predicted nucleotidyltransferase